jgi:hypothetical protein
MDSRKPHKTEERVIIWATTPRCRDRMIVWVTKPFYRLSGKLRTLIAHNWFDWNANRFGNRRVSGFWSR